MEDIGRATANSVIELIGEGLALVNPAFALVKPAVDLANNIANAVLVYKLKRFFWRVNYSKEKWERFCREKLDKSGASYEDTIKHIVLVVDSMNDEQKIDTYANLTRAYMEDRFSLAVFLELTDIVSTVSYNKTVFLQKFVSGNIVGRNNTMIMLQSHDLIECKNEGSWVAVDPQHMEFGLTELGQNLVEYGLCESEE